MKRDRQDTSDSRFLSLILRHHPERIGISLDAHGWAEIEALIAGMNKSRPFDREKLLRIVSEDEKGRYAISGDGRRIRANQGHSVPVDVELEKRLPPEILYHGSAEKSSASIGRQGLLPMGRLYVHLSAEAESARKVGQRHGKCVLYRVFASRMQEDGFDFFLSKNGVWLTKAVPPAYLEREALT